MKTGTAEAVVTPPSEFLRLNPADNRDIVGSYVETTDAEAEQRLRAAQQAFLDWRTRNPAIRARILHRTAELLRQRSNDIAPALTREEGKPLAAATGEVQRAADALDYFAGLAEAATGTSFPSNRSKTLIVTRAEPRGVVLAITPFNFPLFVAVLKLGPALAAGNVVAWKPSPYTSATSACLAKAFLDAGLPPGVLTLLLGSRPQLGQYLVEHSTVRAITFTGSTAVGRDVGIRAAQRQVPAQQEMGGKNVLAIDRGFDLETAAALACDAAFGESGQKCTATGLVVLHRDHLDEFLGHVELKMRAIRIGNGLQEGVGIGPLISNESVSRVRNIVAESIDAGATSLLDNLAVEVGDLTHGSFFQPQVVLLPQGHCRLRTDEIFAPVMAISTVNDVRESLLLLNTLDYGLSTSILTDDVHSAMRFAERAPVGMVNINLPTTGIEYQAEFGGWGDSGGSAREAGPHALDFFRREKTISIGWR